MSDSATHKSRTARSYDELRDAIVEARYAPGGSITSAANSRSVPAPFARRCRG